MSDEHRPETRGTSPAVITTFAGGRTEVQAFSEATPTEIGVGILQQEPGSQDCTDGATGRRAQGVVSRTVAEIAFQFGSMESAMRVTAATFTMYYATASLYMYAGLVVFEPLIQVRRHRNFQHPDYGRRV